MRRRTSSILLVWLLGFHALVGGLRGDVAICLGGGHEHAPDEVVAACDLECAHESAWPAPPAPRTARSDDRGCTCTDLEFTLTELVTTVRGGAPTVSMPPAAPAPECLAAVLALAPDRREAPPRLLDDPGGRHRLAVVRTTRLLI